MDNAQKAIMIGVSLFITVIVIAAVMTITGIGQDLLRSGQAQLTQISAQLVQSLTLEYDGAQVGGGKVLAAVKQYYNDENIVVYVDNGYGPLCTTPNNLESAPPLRRESGRIDVTDLDIGLNENRISLSAFTAFDNDPTNRIVTTSQYQANLLEKNGEVIGIGFMKKVIGS